MMRPGNFVSDDEIRRSCLDDPDDVCPECGAFMDRIHREADSTYPECDYWRCSECDFMGEPE